MSTMDDHGLVSTSDIAEIAGVSRGAVSNWRKRRIAFPQQVGGTNAKPLFSRSAVVSWLHERGYTVDHDGGETNVWAALNTARDILTAQEAMDLVLTLALGRLRGQYAEVDDALSEEAVAPVRTAMGQVATDNLGDVADYCLERLARAQGKAGQTGAVGSRTSVLLGSLAAIRPGGVLYDPVCGIGAALIEAHTAGVGPDRIVGHDVDAHVLRIARQRAQLHGIDLETVETDVLAEDVDPSLRADTVIAEPPFGAFFHPSSRLTDPRFTFGVPPRTSADTAWLQHAIAHLTDTGRAYVLTAPQALTGRHGKQHHIRMALLEYGCIEAVVALPGKMLPYTTIPLALWVLRRPAPEPPEAVLLIDASESHAPEQYVRSWLDDPESHADDIAYKNASTAELLDADAVLTPQLWTNLHEPAAKEIAGAYRSGRQALTAAVENLETLARAFDPVAPRGAVRVMTVGQLVDENVLVLHRPRTSGKRNTIPTAWKDRIIHARDVRDGLPEEAAPTGTVGVLPGGVAPTEAGDVLVTTMHETRARVDTAGGHITTTGVHLLRSTNHEVLLPDYLALMLTGRWNARFQTGSTIARADVRDLEIPLLPADEQRALIDTAAQLTQLQTTTAALADAAESIVDALSDSARYTTTTP